MGGWAFDEDPPTPTAERLLQNARRLYDRISEVTEAALQAPGGLTVTRELILEYHRIATHGDSDPDKPPGRFRERDNAVKVAGIVLYDPPPWQQVEELVADYCRVLTSKLNSSSTIHAAAYALWRLNWIHPFGDGNGKTSRGVMYTVLCIGFGRMLPGEPALPDLMARAPGRYWRSLIAADTAWKRGELDVAEVELLISDLVEQVLGVT